MVLLELLLFFAFRKLNVTTPRPLGLQTWSIYQKMRNFMLLDEFVFKFWKSLLISINPLKTMFLCSTPFLLDGLVHTFDPYIKRCVICCWMIFANSDFKKLCHLWIRYEKQSSVSSTPSFLIRPLAIRINDVINPWAFCNYGTIALKLFKSWMAIFNRQLHFPMICIKIP